MKIDFENDKVTVTKDEIEGILRSKSDHEYEVKFKELAERIREGFNVLAMYRYLKAKSEEGTPE